MGFFDTLKGLFTLESFYTEPEKQGKMLLPGVDSIVSTTNVVEGAASATQEMTTPEVAPTGPLSLDAKTPTISAVQPTESALLAAETSIPSNETPVIAQDAVPTPGAEVSTEQRGRMGDIPTEKRLGAVRGLVQIVAARSAHPTTTLGEQANPTVHSEQTAVGNARHAEHHLGNRTRSDHFSPISPKAA